MVPDGTAAAHVENPTTDYVPNARPGGRAPHVWLDRRGERVSTLDLFGRGLVVLAGSEGQSWRDAAREIGARGIPVEAYCVGRSGDLIDKDDVWASTYGVERDGVVIVRPDGHVAWRCATSTPQPKEELERVLNTVLRG
jgi:putative polyketide hydroxylase